jgi:very-short-patch-repair endonuclease
MYRDEEQREFARSLRKGPTEAEKRLWHFLRTAKLRGHKFRRQAAIGPYIVDFICFEMKLIVELDGPQHSEPNATEFDQRRTAWLAARGFRVMRFRNQELDESIDAVMEAIGRALVELEAKNPLPGPSRKGRGTNQNERWQAGGRQRGFLGCRGPFTRG